MALARDLSVLSFAVLAVCAVEAQTSTPPASMTVQAYDALFTKVNNSSRWGRDDTRGTLNQITAETRLAAVRDVRTGECVSLSRPVEAGSVPGALEPAQVAGFDLADGDIHWLAERITLVFHGYAFSHLDALSHSAFRGRAYNGVNDTPADRARLGIENVETGLVSRGVLVDLPALRGVEYLEPGSAYTPADMEAWEKKAGITVGRGDVVLIRTGRWVRQKALGPVDATRQLAGPHPTMAEWLHQRGVAAVGDDGANDLAPSVVPGVSHAFHQLALVSMGMPLLDNQDLDRLAAACAAAQRWTFLFVAAPLRIQDATGSPVNALAMF
jgi:kynurenine formamidase